MTAALLAGLAVWCAVPAPATGRLRDLAGHSATSRRVDPGWVAALMAPIGLSVLLGLPLGPVVGLAAAPVVLRAVRRLETASDRRRTAELRSAMPAALDLMVAALSVGRPPMTAVALAAEATRAPLGPELASVAHRLVVTADADLVWRALSDDPAFGPVARAFRRADDTGMPVAQVVSGVADELRREVGAERREQSRRVAVRTAAPLGACFLPAFFLVGIVPTVVATFGTFQW